MTAPIFVVSPLLFGVFLSLLLLLAFCIQNIVCSISDISHSPSGLSGVGAGMRLREEISISPLSRDEGVLKDRYSLNPLIMLPSLASTPQPHAAISDL